MIITFLEFLFYSYLFSVPLSFILLKYFNSLKRSDYHHMEKSICHTFLFVSLVPIANVLMTIILFGFFIKDKLDKMFSDLNVFK